MGSEDNFVDMVLSFHLGMSPGDETQAAKLAQHTPPPAEPSFRFLIGL